MFGGFIRESMMRKIHFISGLPRSGSTLLSAILRQNPAFDAAMSSPVGTIFNACLTAMGPENEFSVFLTEQHKRDILMATFDAYYRDRGPDRLVFDTNRMWTSRLPALLQLFPGAKVICCVRNPGWVLDSVESLIRRNAFDVSRMFSNPAERSSVYARAEALLGRNRMIGSALTALKEAYWGNEAGALLLVDYDLLTARPQETMKLIYQFIGEPWFAHDFEHVEYQAEEFDTQMMAPGLHTVRGRVEYRSRRSILPPELFRQFADLAFWSSRNNTLAHHIVSEPLPAVPPPSPAV